MQTMRGRVWARITSLTLALVFTVSLVPSSAADKKMTPAETDNLWRKNASASNTTRYSEPNHSYLRANNDGSFTRVEHYVHKDFDADHEHITVEEYGADMTLRSRTALPVELGRFLGALITEDGIYITSAAEQGRPDDWSEAEVMRVVRYSRDGQQRLAAATITGRPNYEANPVPKAVYVTQASNLDMLLDGDRLVIYTSYMMETNEEDGLQHQANYPVILNAKDLAYSKVPTTGLPYVSHSFSQLVRSDGNGGVVFADLGDAYPRAIQLSVVKFLPGEYWEGTYEGTLGEDSTTFLPFEGASGENYTGGRLTGLEVSSSAYLTCGTVLEPGAYSLTNERIGNRLFLGVTNRNTMETDVKTMDSLALTGGEQFQVPQLVSLGGNRFLLMWGVWNEKQGQFTADCKAKVQLVDGNGKALSEVKELDAPLSDCQPVVKGGLVTWYVTQNSAPVFYQLNTTDLSLKSWDTGSAKQENARPIEGSQTNFTYDKNISTTFSDVAASSWYANGVTTACQLGLMKGAAENQFHPNGELTVSQTVALAARIHAIYTTGTADFTQGNPWYQVYLDYCLEHGVLTQAPANMDGKITRGDFVAMLDGAVPVENFPLKNGAVQSYSIPDVNPNADYAAAVLRFYRAGITGGDSTGAFQPNKTITRAEVAAIVSRIADPDLTVYSPVNGQISQNCKDTFPFTWPEIQGWVDPAKVEPTPSPAPSYIPQTPNPDTEGIQDPNGFYQGMAKKPEIAYDKSLDTAPAPADAPKVTGIEVVEYAEYWDPNVKGHTIRFQLAGTSGYSAYRMVCPAYGDPATINPASGGTAMDGGGVKLDNPRNIQRIGQSSRIYLISPDGTRSTWFHPGGPAMDVKGITFTENKAAGTITLTGLKAGGWYCVSGYNVTKDGGMSADGVFLGSKESLLPVLEQAGSSGTLTVSAKGTVHLEIYLQYIDPSGSTIPTPTLIWPY